MDDGADMWDEADCFYLDIVCKHCEVSGLYWEEARGKRNQKCWVLMEPNGKIHVCKNRRGARCLSARTSGMTLCVDVAVDGLKCDRDYPNCVHLEECAAKSCFWRRFHDIQAEKMRADEPPKYRELLK